MKPENSSMALTWCTLVGHVVGHRGELAGGVLVALLLERLVGDAHLDVVGLTREDQQGLVLGLPAEPGDRSIVAVAIARPLMPRLCLVNESAARLLRMVVSESCSMSPAPKVGVGIRKMMLRFATCLSKSSCTAVQALALPVSSTRPLITNRPWTPPSRLPSGLNWNRASRIGPSRLTKDGTLFLAPKAVAMAT